MLTRRIRTLAITGTTIVAAALVVLGTTGASAATMTASAPGHVTMPRTTHAAVAASGCVTETFTKADERYDLSCVTDAQILINNLWRYQIDEHANDGINQQLTVDGSYGPATASDVGSFQTRWFLQVDQELGPHTWYELCAVNRAAGFTGIYWHGAGCATEPGL